MSRLHTVSSITHIEALGRPHLSLLRPNATHTASSPQVASWSWIGTIRDLTTWRRIINRDLKQANRANETRSAERIGACVSNRWAGLEFYTRDQNGKTKGFRANLIDGKIYENFKQSNCLHQRRFAVSRYKKGAFDCT